MKPCVEPASVPCPPACCIVWRWVMVGDSLEILRGTGGENGGGYIEVRPRGVNKGAFVQAILSRQVSGRGFGVGWMAGSLGGGGGGGWRRDLVGDAQALVWMGQSAVLLRHSPMFLGLFSSSCLSFFFSPLYG